MKALTLCLTPVCFTHKKQHVLVSHISPTIGEGLSKSVLVFSAIILNRTPPQSWTDHLSAVLPLLKDVASSGMHLRIQEMKGGGGNLGSTS